MHLKKSNRYLLYIGVFLTSILIYIGILIIDSAYPFGDRSFLTYDAYVQYNNMLKTFIEWLHSGDKSAILWDKGLGIGIYQDIIYYCMSPFNIIAVILGENHVELSLVLIIIIKASCISVSALYFFEHTNKRKCENELGTAWLTLISVACSMAYGFCGYVLAYEHNIIWLDGMIILPIIAIGIERLVDKSDYRMYLCWLSISFVVNFYYAFYICLFSVIYFLVENRNSFREFVRKSLLFAGISVLAALISGIVLIPAVCAIKNAAPSMTGINQAGIEEWGKAGEYIASFYPFKGITCGYLFNNNSFCGSVVIFLVIIFITSGIFTFKQKLKYVTAIALLVLGLNWIKLNYVLHGFAVTHGMGNRFAIILTFILIVMGYMVIININKLRLKDILFSFVIWCIICAVSIIDNRDMIVPWAYIVFGLLSILYIMLFILYIRKSIKIKTIIAWICLTWLCEIGVNIFYVMPDKTEDIQMTESIQLSEWNEAYSILDTDAGERKTALVKEDYAPKTETSWYSSMVNGNAVRAFKSMGMGHFDNVEYVYNGTTPLTALMYNVRYILSDEIGTSGGYHTILENDVYNVYEADALAGMGYVLNEDIAEWKGNKLAAENQNDFASLGCGVDGELFKEVNLSQAKTKYYCMDVLTSEEGYYLYKTNCSYSPNVQLEFVADKDMELYLFSSDTREQIVEVDIDGEEVVSSKYYLTEIVSDIGEVKKGQSISIRLYGAADANPGQVGEKYFKLYEFDRELFEQAKKKILNETMEFVGYEGNTFTGRITSENGGVLYLAFPYNDGFTIYVDGESVDKLRLGDGFMGIYLSSGEHEITIEYHTPGLAMGLCVSLAGLIILCVIIILRHIPKTSLLR
ncbi:MAG: YfhO family protein [Coprococcus sp.]